MILCVAGDIHGALDRMFADILTFEAALSMPFDWVLHVGDFGVWPDPSRIDGATRRHDGAGDFPCWFTERRAAPRPTVFIKGNHEDFVWLDAQPNPEVVPGLFYLRNGHVQELRVGDDVLRVGGIGGCFGPSDFERPSASLQGYSKRHYTRDEIAVLASSGRLDIVLTHDAPAGVPFERHRRGAGYVSEAAGLDDLLARTQPRICFFGHHHTRLETVIAGVPCRGLNKAPHAGSLLAVEMSAGRRNWRILGEWPPAPNASAKAAKPGKPKSELRRSLTNAAVEADDDLDARVDGLAERLVPLVRQLKALQDQARALGIFPNDRELLACPHCGLAEDVLADGRLITSYEIGEADTGLRFIEPESDDGPFTCAGCGGEVHLEEV